MSQWLSKNDGQSLERGKNVACNDDWKVYEQPKGQYYQQQNRYNLQQHHTALHNNDIKKNSNQSFQTSDKENRTGGRSLHLPSALESSFMTGEKCQNRKPTVVLPDEYSSTLGDEQRVVVESVLSGFSTFFTGPAGSGKSHVLNMILQLNEEELISRKKRIVVTATTGIAACAVGGITIHSFAGVGTGEGSIENLVGRVMGNSYTKARWREVDILVIDEISMMPAGFLDTLNFVAGRARNDRRIFGGIQIVMCGDFFQLPPVNLKTGFAFEAKCWPDLVRKSVLLKQIYRQKGDKVLMKILNEARIGCLSKESTRILQKHCIVSAIPQVVNVDLPVNEHEVKETQLECRNQQVDSANHRELAKLPGETLIYKSKDRALNDSYMKQLRHCSANEKINLKVGAQVMLLKNIDPEKGLVNGSRGVVVGFKKHPNKSNDMPREFKSLDLPYVQFESVNDDQKCHGDDDSANSTKKDDLLVLVEPSEWTNRIGDSTVSSRTQIPLRLAWAMSVHKSQGMTIPNLSVNLKGVFEYGQSYVALSRATTLSLLKLHGFDERSFRAHPKVKRFYQLMEGTIGVDDVKHKGNTPSLFSKQDQENKSSNSCNGLSQGENNKRQIITNDQRRRMEDNRQRALAIKRRKQQHKKQEQQFCDQSSLFYGSLKTCATNNIDEKSSI